MSCIEMPTAGLEPAHLTAPDPKTCDVRGEWVRHMHSDRGNVHGDAQGRTTSVTTCSALALLLVGGR